MQQSSHWLQWDVPNSPHSVVLYTQCRYETEDELNGDRPLLSGAGWTGWQI